MSTDSSVIQSHDHQKFTTLTHQLNCMLLLHYNADLQLKLKKNGNTYSLAK
jgi:hypothetical protein